MLKLTCAHLFFMSHAHSHVLIHLLLLNHSSCHTHAQYEGVLVQDTYEAHAEAWRRVAQEFDLPRPLGHTYRY